MIMSFIEHLDTTKSLFLGPILHCGYIPLINDLDHNNCASIKCVLNGKLRILIYTTQKIVKGEQLGYSYGFKRQTVLK